MRGRGKHIFAIFFADAHFTKDMGSEVVTSDLLSQ